MTSKEKLAKIQRQARDFLSALEGKEDLLSTFRARCQDIQAAQLDLAGLQLCSEWCSEYYRLIELVQDLVQAVAEKEEEHVSPLN